METIKQIHHGWDAWNKSKKIQDILPNPTFGKWHYIFQWEQHHASMVQCVSGMGGLIWEIWCTPEDEDPKQCGSRNECLDYMYKKWLGLDDIE